MTVAILIGDCRDVLPTLPDEFVHCVVTSPPYWGLRDYGVAGQLGLEQSLGEHVDNMVGVFREVRRVLRKDGTLWLNYGDSYATSVNGRSAADTKAAGNDDRTFRDKPFSTVGNGLKPKDLCGIPWRVAFALQADGWWLRQDIIWSKGSPMPESVRDRCCKSHEYLFLLTKSPRYYFDGTAIAETTNDGNTRTKRSVWHINSEPFTEWGEIVRRVRVAWDAPDDGKKRITSQDCPLHAGFAATASSAVCGERADGQMRRSGRNNGRREITPQDDCAGTVTPLEAAIAERSSDLPSQSCEPSAISHNMQNHKTDHASATNLACMPCDETDDYIDGKSTQSDCSDSVVRKHESSTVEDGLGDNPASQTDGRIAGKSSVQVSFSASHGSHCTCEYYIEITEKTSHFATFPPALIEPCIRAGTSEMGCCARCRAPWVRETRSTTSFQGGSGAAGRSAEHVNANGKWAGKQYGKNIKLGPVVNTETVGWHNSCGCIQGPPIPCTVLDPFGGAGTTGLVADRLGRNAILIELNPQYAAMADRRLRGDAGMFAQISYGEAAE